MDGYAKAQNAETSFQLNRLLEDAQTQIKQLQSQLAEVQRERDALASHVELMRQSIQSNCYDDPSQSGRRLIELASQSTTRSYDDLKRREWVRAINYAIDDYKREYVGQGIETLFNDLAERIESGEVDL